MQSLLFIGKKNSFVGELLTRRLKKYKIKIIFFDKEKNFFKSFIKNKRLKINFLWTNFGVPIDAEVIDLIDNPKLIIISQSTGLNHINYNGYPILSILFKNFQK